MQQTIGKRNKSCWFSKYTSTVCWGAIWPSIFLTQIRYQFSIAKMCKESHFTSIFVQSRHYFFQVFYSTKSRLFLEYFKVKFCSFEKIVALEKSRHKMWFFMQLGYRICVRNIEGHIAPKHTVSKINLPTEWSIAKCLSKRFFLSVA